MVDQAKHEIQLTKKEVEDNGNDEDKREAREIEREPKAALQAKDSGVTKNRVEALSPVRFRVMGRNPGFWVGWFQWCEERKCATLLPAPNFWHRDTALQSSDLESLKSAVRQLLDQMPEEEQKKIEHASAARSLRYARKKSIVLETEGLGVQRFHGRVVVLVNEHTTCAAEMIALFAQERGLATIVGVPTPRRLVSHRGFDIGHGFTLVVPTAAYVSWMGTRLDGTGIKPDVQADWSYEEIVRENRDVQLERAHAAVRDRVSAIASVF